MFQMSIIANVLQYYDDEILDTFNNDEMPSSEEELEEKVH
ncbi:unnamed protein product [Strongylus vulgaris]|uniref:Uncharacterized protein n=1 Tax=Strongylus vulgaris TaxID=40348 RepID=A0A3P7IR96_STRVU|nr:unnamed protein product [Strongylus vulgaris]